MKKIVLRGIVALVVLAVVGLVAAYLFMGRIIEKAIETAGPVVTKCPVSVGRVDFRPLRGKLRIVNLEVGNPEGFKTPSAFKVDEVRLAMVPRSVFSDLIEVEEIYIGGPQITYEMGLGSTNIGTILDNVDAFTKSVAGADTEPKSAKAEPPAGAKKRVTIAVVKVEEGQINLSGTLLQGAAVPVVLPGLEMHDIGKNDPVTGAEAAAEILGRILHGVMDSVKQSGKAIVDAAQGIGEALKGNGGELKKGIDGAVNGVKGLFKKGN